MKKRRTVAIITMAVMLATMAWGCALNNKQELFSSVRAYRTAIEQVYIDYVELDDPIVIDPPGTVDDSLRQEYLNAFNLINDERSANGLAPMMWDSGLEWDAFMRANELCTSFSEDHTLPDGQLYFMHDPKNIMGETIYKGYKEADKVIPALLNNKPDKENFLCEYFTKMGISIYEDADKNFYWAILYGADTISVSFEDEVQTGSVWIIWDIESNRSTSVWGAAMMTPDEVGGVCSAGIPRSKDNKYLLRMIDDDGLYYDAEIPELFDGWKLRLYRLDEITGASDVLLDVIDESGNVVQTCSVFCAAL